MDLALSEEQSLILQSVKRYCDEHLDVQSAAGARRTHDHWARFAEMGWLGVLVSPELGGLGGTMVETSIILEQFGRRIVTEPYLACAVIAASVLGRTADNPQCASLLSAIAAGSCIVSLGLSEGRTERRATIARARSSGGYVVDGSKALVLSGPRSNKFVVSVRIEDDIAPADTGLILVERGESGVVCRDYATLDGRGATDLRLDGVVVDKERVLLRGAEAEAAIAEATERAIVGVCAEAVGAMQHVIAVTAEHLKTRRAYGTTLSTYQSLQHRMADMLVEYEMSRSMLYRLLAALSLSDVRARCGTVSSAKGLIGRASKFVAANGLQLHGAIGMVNDFSIGKHFKQLTMIEALFGNSAFHWAQCADTFVSAGEPRIGARA